MEPLKPAQVALYAKAHSADRPCAACGAKDWEMTPEDRHGIYAVQSFAKLADPHDQATQPVVQVHCRQCSAIRTYLRKPIVDWLEKNRHG